MRRRPYVLLEPKIIMIEQGVNLPGPVKVTKLANESDRHMNTTSSRICKKISPNSIPAHHCFRVREPVKPP